MNVSVIWIIKGLVRTAILSAKILQYNMTNLVRAVINANTLSIQILKDYVIIDASMFIYKFMIQFLKSVRIVSCFGKDMIHIKEKMYALTFVKINTKFMMYQLDYGHIHLNIVKVFLTFLINIRKTTNCSYII